MIIIFSEGITKLTLYQINEETSVGCLSEDRRKQKCRAYRTLFNEQRRLEE